MFVVAHNGSRVFGGGELGTVRLLAGLQERGHRVLMLFRDEAMAERAATYGIPTGVSRIGGGVMVQDALFFARRLRRERPDALILTTFKKVFLAGLGARLAGVPRVVQRIVLETDTPARGALYRVAFRRFVDVIALNAESMRGPFLAADPGLDARKVVTIHDGVHPPERVGPPGAFRRELSIPDGARVMGTVARLSKQKRLERFVRALASLPVDVYGIIVGEGPDQVALESLAKELGVHERIRFPGFRRDIGDVYAAFDVYVVTSDTEGMSNAMLEAMWCGVPVVSTRVSGADEALAPFEDGSAPGLVTGFEQQETNNAIARVIGNGASHARMSSSARRRTDERFSNRAMVDYWNTLLTPPR